MNRDPIFELAPRKIARILSLTLASDREDNDLGNADVAGLLDRCLHARLPVEDFGELTWTDLVANLTADQEASRGTVLADVLTASGSSLKSIRSIRRCAKQRAARNAMDPEYSVAITLYFAAIANALLFHGTKITTYSYDSLETSFNRLVSKPWMPEELGNLLTEARGYCRDRR